MTRRNEVKLPGGPLEWSVMHALWSGGGALNAHGVQEKIDPRKKLAYTSVAKVLDRLLDKGLVERDDSLRPHTFTARLTKAVVEGRHARDSLSMFLRDGVEPAATTLIDAAASLDAELLDALAAAIARKRRDRRGA